MKRIWVCEAPEKAQERHYRLAVSCHHAESICADCQVLCGCESCQPELRGMTRIEYAHDGCGHKDSWMEAVISTDERGYVVTIHTNDVTDAHRIGNLLFMPTRLNI